MGPTVAEWQNTVKRGSLFALFLFLCVISLFLYLEYWVLTIILLSFSILFFFGVTIKYYYNGYPLLCYLSLLAVTIFVFAFIYYKFGVIDTAVAAGPPVKNKGISIYFSIVTFTTLGYGDFKPIAEARLYAASEAIIGMSYMSMLIALLLGRISRRF